MNIYMKDMKQMKSQTALLFCQMHIFPIKSCLPKIFRMLTFVYVDDDNNTTNETNTGDNDMHIATALAQLC